MSKTEFSLVFHPAEEEPTEQGAYLIYNQCDGYHIVDAWFDQGEFIGFWVFAADRSVPRDFYCAWAKLPDTNKELRPIFAKD